MTAPAPETVEREREKLYVTDAELIRRLGVPDTVKNMDSRAGAITEATDSGASLEDVRHAATHSNIAMTQRYSRNAVKKTANVMEMRVKSRNKTGTE